MPTTRRRREPLILPVCHGQEACGDTTRPKIMGWQNVPVGVGRIARL